MCLHEAVTSVRAIEGIGPVAVSLLDGQDGGQGVDRPGELFINCSLEMFIAKVTFLDAAFCCSRGQRKAGNSAETSSYRSGASGQTERCVLVAQGCIFLRPP